MGVLQWIVSIGIIDIQPEVISAYSTTPTYHHLNQIGYIFEYLAQTKQATLHVKINSPVTLDQDWAMIFGELDEELPADVPGSLGEHTEPGDLITSRWGNQKSWSEMKELLFWPDHAVVSQITHLNN